MRKFRTIAAALVIGVTSLSVIGTADAATKKVSNTPRCHAIVKGKKAWSTKFCPKPGKPGVNGVNGKDGFNGTNGANGAPGVQGERGKDGVDGRRGDDGINGKDGANGSNGLNGVSGYEVRTWNYDSAGPGSVATVACSSESKVAVGGGYFIRNANNTDMSVRPHTALENGAGVIASFPGRMDWSTNSPKPNRNDGWIVQFNDKMSGPVTLYVACINAA